MLPAIIPIAALAGLGVIAYVVTHPSDTSKQTAPVMSPPMKSAFQALLAGSDPDAMDASANALEPFGFLAEASQLRARAKVLRTAKASGTTPPPPPQTQTGTGPGTPASQAQLQTGTGPGTPGALAQAAAQQSGNAIELPDANGNFDAPTAAQVAAAAAAANAGQPIDILAQAQAALAAKSGGASLPSFAVVTTNDPAPVGDLAIREAPNGPITPGVGAEKGGIVTVIKSDVLGDGVWSQVVWAGGSRLPPASGFVKTAFLRPSAVGPMGTAIAGENIGQARCVAPSGCRLRKSPSAVADFRAIVGHGEVVKVLDTVAGDKREAFSPSRGGWAKVQYGKNKLEGWLPREWLVRS